MKNLTKRLEETVETFTDRLERFREQQMEMHEENRKNFSWMLRAALAVSMATISSLLSVIAFIIWYLIAHPEALSQVIK